MKNFKLILIPIFLSTNYACYNVNNIDGDEIFEISSQSVSSQSENLAAISTSGGLVRNSDFEKRKKYTNLYWGDI